LFGARMDGTRERADMTNREFRKDKIFRKCCEKMEILPTTRQASKFRNGKGLAIKAVTTIKREAKNVEKAKD